MSTNYPTSLDTFTNPSTADPLTNPPHAAQHANANDAIAALQAKVGVDSSSVNSSIDYLIRHLNSVDIHDFITAVHTLANVLSVFGRTGVVTAQSGDYTASKVSNDSGVSGTTVKDALDTLSSGGGGAVSSVFSRTGAITAQTGDYTVAQVTNAVATSRTITAGTGLTGGGTLAADRTLTVDYGTSGSTSCVGNDGRLSDVRIPTSHATSHKSGGSDSIKLDEMDTPTDVTTLNATTSAHGLLPKLDNNAAHYLDGQGGWTTPSGGGGSSSPGGSDTQVQFNDSGNFGGDTPFTYNKTNHTLSIQSGGLTIHIGDGTQAGQFINGTVQCAFSTTTIAASCSDNVRTATICDGTNLFSGTDGTRTAKLADGVEAGYFADGFRTSKLCDGTEAGYFSDGTRVITIAGGTYAIDVSVGSINVLGTSTNTFRWNSNSTAPTPQSLIALPLSAYGQGTINQILGTPDDWVLINRGGQDYKIPLYL